MTAIEEVVSSLLELSVSNEQRESQQQRPENAGCEGDSGSSSRSSNADEECDGAQFMDAQLWGNLPEHLLEAVLAWLPPASLLRLRSVCKRWNAMVTSAGFLDACSRIRRRSPYFLMFADHFHRRLAAVYDLELRRWHLLDFQCFLHCRFPESFLVLASAGGLLCLEGTGSQSGCMFISNPIARRFRKLPPMVPMRSPYVVGMVMGSCSSGDGSCSSGDGSCSSGDGSCSSGSYKVLVAQDGEQLQSQVYDSRSDSWRLTGVLNRRTAILAGAALYEGMLYCLTFSPNGLLAFDLEEGAWKTVDIPLPPVTCPNLITHRGRLLLIGGTEELGTLQSFKIYMLNVGNNGSSNVNSKNSSSSSTGNINSSSSSTGDVNNSSSTGDINNSSSNAGDINSSAGDVNSSSSSSSSRHEWVECVRLPEEVFKRLFVSSSGHFICVAYGDYLVLHEYYSPEILLFNLVSKTWQWLPRCCLGDNIERRAVLGYAFEPRVEAVP